MTWLLLVVSPYSTLLKWEENDLPVVGIRLARPLKGFILRQALGPPLVKGMFPFPIALIRSSIGWLTSPVVSKVLRKLPKSRLLIGFRQQKFTLLKKEARVHREWCRWCPFICRVSPSGPLTIGTRIKKWCKCRPYCIQCM